jgi:putative cobalt transporter subunit CbtB
VIGEPSAANRKSDLTPLNPRRWDASFPGDCQWLILRFPLKSGHFLFPSESLYFVGAEEGATSVISGMYVHEFVHDARHLLGFPCH